MKIQFKEQQVYTKETSRDRVLTDQELTIIWQQLSYGDYEVIMAF